MFNKRWFADTLERLVRTFAQVAIGAWLVSGIGDFSMPALRNAALAGFSAALSLAMSIIGALNTKAEAAAIVAPAATPVGVPGGGGYPAV